MATVAFDMKNGTVDLTLDFYSLHQLKSKHPDEYKRYFEIAKSVVRTDMEAIEVLYVAYLCANMEKMPDVMSYEEFLKNAYSNRNMVWEAYNNLNLEEKN